jgi:FkbM family methyltransferase
MKNFNYFILDQTIDLYVKLFARKYFINFNKLLYRLSLGGLGILNHKTSAISGELAFLNNYLLDKMGVVIDVGANIGNYSKEALEINPYIKVVAFEPHPETFSKLSENLSSYASSVKLINKGVSSHSGVLELFDYANSGGSGHASLFQDVLTNIHGSDNVVSHSVELTTIDNFINQEEISEIILLKIDTEGNELEILKGAKQSLLEKKIKAIHFEFNEMNVISRSYFRDFWEMLGDFRIYRLLPKEIIEIKKYTPLFCEVFAYQNIVAILKD